MVEFALVSLILLIIVFGIIEFGFLWLQSFYIANAAREGARVAATLPKPKTDDRDKVEEAVKDYLKGLYSVDTVNAGCCCSGDFIEVAVADGDQIHVSGTPTIDVDTIKVSVKVKTAEIWRPVLWDLLKLIVPTSRNDIGEIKEFAVFAVEK